MATFKLVQVSVTRFLLKLCELLQILTQSIEDSLEPRVEFFTKKMGVSKERLAKMVTRHPQLLHYSVQDGIRPRVNYLRSIGMTKADVGKVLSRLTQVSCSPPPQHFP
jgi:mTERF domain-containing protein